MPTLHHIALRPKQRGMLAGGTGVGKSTLAEELIEDFLRHTGRLSHCLIVDTKPRFRAQWELDGVSTSVHRRYSRWDHGAYVDDSVLLNLDRGDGGLSDVWKLGHRVAVAQCEAADRLRDTLRVMTRFFKEARASRPQLLYVDEGLDFFGPTGVRLGGNDILLRCQRAGREKGLSVLTGFQRPVGIPQQFKSELDWLYLFRLDSAKDYKHLADIGLPEDLAPKRKHEFLAWNKDKRAGAYFKLGSVGNGG